MIVIIGILAVGLVPKVIDAPKKARDTVRKKDLDSIKVALESYYADNSKYPADQAAVYGMTSYFQGATVPVDPSDKTVKYEYKYQAPANGAAGCYILSAKMDSVTGGNFDKPASDGTATCTAALSSGKPYYLTIGGN